MGRSARVLLAVAIVVSLLVIGVFPAAADGASLDFESYLVGTVDGQDGWASLGSTGSGCAVYDHAVADQTLVPAFGGRSLRISNAVTSGCLSDQTFSKSLLNEAGEAAATSGGKSGGTRQRYFEAQWSFASTVPSAEQAGLSVSVSPDRGDGGRMSYARIYDTPTGLAVEFYDYQVGVGALPDDHWVSTVVAAGLNRTQAHTVKLAMWFVDGPSNDVVEITVDGTLKHTGTSWEDYFLFDPEAAADPTTKTVDSLAFLTRGTAVPATAGQGFLIDNLSLYSGSGPLCTGTCYVDAGAGSDSNGGASASDAMKTIQAALSRVSAGGTINVAAGTYLENGPIVISKSVTVAGAGAATTTIMPNQNTGASGDLRGWFLVQSGVAFNLSGVTLDGTGKLVNIGVLSHGTGTISDCVFTDLGYNPSGPDYAGRGIALYGPGNTNVTRNTLSNIGRIGVYLYGAGTTALIDANTYVGKGAGNWLDYAFEIEGGASATITNNTVSDCLGVASVDGSVSAGILATTYFAPGTTAVVTGNTFTRCSDGVYVGYTATDTSSVVVHNNRFESSLHGVSSTGPSVDATENWWGSVTGPAHTTNPRGQGAAVTDNVDFSPWTDQSYRVLYSLVGALQVVTEAGTFFPGDTLYVDVVANDVVDLAGLVLDLKFDPSALEVQTVGQAGSFFGWGWQDSLNGFSNTAGTIHYEVTMPAGGAAASGDGAILRITFKAKQAGTTSVLILDQLLSDKDGNVLVPSVLVNGAVTIGQSSHISGSIVLQGRADDSLGRIALGSLLSQVTASDGLFAFDVTPGIYPISLEMAGYLDASRAALDATGNVSLGAVTLRFGDVNDDEIVNIQDMSFIAYRYGTHSGETRWAGVADMNLNSVIDIYDLTAAAGNYGSASTTF